MSTVGTPDEGGPTALGRRRALALGGAITGLLLCAAALAVATRSTGSNQGAPGDSRTAATAPIVARSPGPTTRKPRRATTAIPTTTRTTVAPTSPNRPAELVTTPAAPVATEPAPTFPLTLPPPTAPPTTELLPAVTATLPPLPPLGADALTWTAPAALEIVSGGTATLHVRAFNPTTRTVSLSHPLSCPPRLDGDEMCAGVVQLIGPGQSASATYTIDAAGFAPGHYVLRIEGVLTVPATVS